LFTEGKRKGGKKEYQYPSLHNQGRKESPVRGMIREEWWGIPFWPSRKREKYGL